MSITTSGSGTHDHRSQHADRDPGGTHDPRLRRPRSAPIRFASIVGLACVMVLAAGTSTAFATFGIIQRDAPFGSSSLNNPLGVAVDQSSGNVYVGNLLSVGAFEFGSVSHTYEGSFDNGGLLSGVALDPVNGNLYVVNATEQEIKTYSPTGVRLSAFSIAGSGNLFGTITAVQIATDAAGNVYLPNAPNNDVQEFDPSGNLIQTITGSGATALNAPTGVALDSSGNVYVADTGNGRLEEFTPEGAFIMALGTGVDVTNPGNVCTASSGDVCGPGSDGTKALAIDGAGNIYAGENSGAGYHVVVYSNSGAQLADFGLGSIGSSSFEAAGASDTLAVDDARGLVYVTDSANNEVWVYGPPVAPTLSETSSGATQTAATMNATINPQGQDTHYYFERAAGALGACPSSPQSGSDLASLFGSQQPSEELNGLTPATIYHYRIIAYNATGVTCGADQTLLTLPPAPTLTLGQTGAVEASTATVQGTINPQGNKNWPTVYEVRYGTSTSYTASIHGDAGSASGPVAVTATLENLRPNTTYHYQLTASNAAGTTVSPDQTLTTAGTPPTITLGAASRINEDSALLAGTVNPQGLPTTYAVQYGTTSYYGSLAPAEPAEAGSGFTDESLSLSLAGLQPATLYHYRLIATNTAGTTYGEDQTLTTTGTPPTTTPFTGYTVPTTPAVNAEPINFPAETTSQPNTKQKRSSTKHKKHHPKKKAKHRKKK